MMKETNFGPLLLLLLLAVTPRNSCANPIALPDGMTDGAHVYFSSKIGDSMKEGADSLTTAMTWLKENALSSKFDNSILDLKEQLDKLDPQLAENRTEILEGLFQSQDRLEQLKILLRRAAKHLSEYCLNLIQLYEKDEIELDLLKYGAEEFVAYAKQVNVILSSAFEQTKEIQDLLSASKALLIDFQAKLDWKEKEILDQKNDEGNIQVLKDNLQIERQAIEKIIQEDTQYTNKYTIIHCIFDSGFNCTITFIYTNTMQKAVADRENLDHNVNIQEKRQINIDKTSELLQNIKPAQIAAEKLLCHVEDVKVYLSDEISLIIEWQISLNATIADNTGITERDIKYNIKGIKGRLSVLIEACEDYREHKLPEIFQGE